MDKIKFDIKIKEIAKKDPVLFELESDKSAEEESISYIENYYEAKLPDDYKEFLKQYGGGYFGYIVVFSCDKNGMFYIKDNISKSWIEKKSFFPVIDFETGDYLGFKVKDKVCQNEMVLYSHEENEFTRLDIDFWTSLLKYGFNN